jgi:hypothetical protein
MNINTYTMFYVYKYLREDGTPYYIGKGSGERAYKKWGKKDIKPPEDAARIVIVENNLTEEQAFNLEKKLIAEYGRRDLGTGILYNRTEGGDGSSGHKTSGWKWSEEAKAKRRGPGNPAFGKPSSQRQKEIASSVHAGRTHSKESKVKRSKALTGREILWANKISESLKGRKQDPEVVARRAESCRVAWAKKQINN